MLKQGMTLVDPAIRINVGALGILLMALLPFMAVAQTAHAQDPERRGDDALCWTPEALKARPGEESIRKSVPGAFRKPPVRKTARFAPTPQHMRRPIRRVLLPPGARKLIALTFDLCEQPDEIAGYQGEVFDFLRANGVRATLFAGGKWMVTHPERTQQLITDPMFEVGNHTWEHRNLRLREGPALRDEIISAQLAYEESRGTLAGQCPTGDAKNPRSLAPERMTLFRFPFGACDEKSLNAAGDAGLRVVQWDISSGDPSLGVKVEAMVREVVDKAKPGSIVLFHANGRGRKTAQALPLIVEALKQRKFEFGTVSDLLNVPGAEPEYSDAGCYDVRPHDTEHYDGLARKLDAAHDAAVKRFEASQSKVQGQSETNTNDAAERAPEVLPWLGSPAAAPRTKWLAK